MKKVIKEEAKTVGLSDVNKDRYYGAESKERDLKFLLHEGNNGNYRILTLKEIVFENYGHYDSFQSGIKSAYDDYELYEFDNQDECLAWLYQKD